MNDFDIQQISQSISERYIHYQSRLLEAGFTEATCCTGHFYLQTTDQTAFVVNIDVDEYGLTVLYGFTSTAYLAGDKNWFAQNGSDDTTCQVRNILFAYDENETGTIETITKFYNQYKNCSKEEILALKKERQKAFLDHFSHALKPLGFKKKGTKWTINLCNGTALTFEAQKSAFSDQYYFNVIVHVVSNFYKQLSFKRVVMLNSDIYNWQLMTEKQIEDLIQHILANYISPILVK